MTEAGWTGSVLVVERAKSAVGHLRDRYQEACSLSRFVSRRVNALYARIPQRGPGARPYATHVAGGFETVAAREPHEFRRKRSASRCRKRTASGVQLAVLFLTPYTPPKAMVTASAIVTH
jgi:hypothetical protein